jgi:hypothetical protein
MRRPLYLGEGTRDVGAPQDGRRRVPCDHEGDIPRLVRRIAELAGRERHFSYDASTLREMARRAVVRDGTPMRVGGKSRELRDAVVHGLRSIDPTPSAIIALVDARLDELERLQQDAVDIVAQCREIRADVPVAIGLAVQEIEIWMLGDPAARAAAFGAEAGGASLPEGSAESHADPKHLWATYAGRAPRPATLDPDEHSDLLRVAAWQSMRPDVVAHACPRGFAPFLGALGPALRAVVG